MDIASKARKVCCQNGEDGVIEYLLSLIGEGDKFSVEFGFGKEANSINLLSNKGWHGALFDCDPVSVVHAIDRYLLRQDIEVVRVALTPDNINHEFSKACVPKTIDFLSIDVDGMDLHLLRAIKDRTIRLLCIEYNASFGPELSVTVPYQENFNRKNIHPCYHGASLRAITKVAKEKGLQLVGTEGCGINAFFTSSEDSPLPELSVAEAFKPHSKRGMYWQDQLKVIKQYPLEEV